MTQPVSVTMPAATTGSLPFRRDIEGLRAIAVLAVLAFHLGFTRIPGGFAGVDVFFVISGYLITGLLVQELQKSGEVDLLRFYGRRARRLLPAALLMTLVTLAADAFILAPGEQLRLAKAAGATSLYVSNFWFLHQALDYFGTRSATNPFLHTWSLGVEEQFYLFWPALLLLVSRRKFREIRLAIAISVITLISFALCVWLTGFNRPWAFYASPARAWELGIGGLAALPAVTRWARSSKIMTVVGWFGALALLMSFIVIRQASSFPGVIALLPVMATACLLISGTGAGARSLTGILKVAPLQWFGQRSYSIYLWHWPVIVLVAALYPRRSVALVAGCLALTLLLAAASYRWVENPIRNHVWLSARTFRPVALGVALTGVGVVAAVAMTALASHFANSPAQKAITLATHEHSLASRHGCLLDHTVTEAIPCVFGAASSPDAIVLFGDSHADQWSTPLAAIANGEGWRLVTYLKGSCPVADVPVFNASMHRVLSECEPWRAKAIDAIIALRPKIIVVGEFSSIYSRSGGGTRAENIAAWSAGLQRSLTKLAASGSSIVLLRDTPSPRRDMRRCLENALWRGSAKTCDIPRARAVSPALTVAESQTAASMPKVHFVDLTSQFCGSKICPAQVNGIVVYRDRSHLTNRFAASLEQPLRAALLSSLSP